MEYNTLLLQLWEPGTQCYRDLNGRAATIKPLKTGNMEKNVYMLSTKRT